MKKKININVAGRKFSAELFVLEHLPASTLGNAYHRNKFYDKEKDDYFLERHIPTFEAVFECCYIRREPLRRPEDVHLDVFIEEIRYYRLPERVLSEFLSHEGLQTSSDHKVFELPEEAFQKYRFLPFVRRKLWILFELSDSSRLAEIVSLFSIVTVIISISILCLDTVKSNGRTYTQFQSSSFYVFVFLS